MRICNFHFIVSLQRALLKKATNKRIKQKKGMLAKKARMVKAGASEAELKEVDAIIKKLDEERKASFKGFCENPTIPPCCLAHLHSHLSTAYFGELPINHNEANRRDPVKDVKSWRHFGYSFLPHFFKGAELEDLLAAAKLVTTDRKLWEIGGNVSQIKLFTNGKPSDKNAAAFLVCKFLLITFG